MSEPEAHDYPAAKSYLNLLFEESVANTIVKKLKKAPISEFKAKDIFRASALSLLGVSNSHVEKDRQKIASGKEIAPILLAQKVQIFFSFQFFCIVALVKQKFFLGKYK